MSYVKKSKSLKSYRSNEKIEKKKKAQDEKKSNLKNSKNDRKRKKGKSSQFSSKLERSRKRNEKKKKKKGTKHRSPNESTSDCEEFNESKVIGLQNWRKINFNEQPASTMVLIQPIEPKSKMEPRQCPLYG